MPPPRPLQDNSRLSSDLVRLEKAATERIGDLQRCKVGTRMSRLGIILTESSASKILLTISTMYPSYTIAYSAHNTDLFVRTYMYVHSILDAIPGIRIKLHVRILYSKKGPVNPSLYTGPYVSGGECVPDEQSPVSAQ